MEEKENSLKDRPFAITHEREDPRTEYQIDIDRILYSSEFRRLAGVTQVKSPQDDYVFHDRLTHSLKVAQVAKRLAEYLIKKHSQKNSNDIYIENMNTLIEPDVCYAAGLAHDLGHPPFGHCGESELQILLNEPNFVLEDSFEGNAQTLRIVTSLVARKSITNVDVGDFDFAGVDDCEPGLNLTWRTISAISKYPWTRQLPDGVVDAKSQSQDIYKYKKWGFYNTEEKYLQVLKERNLTHPYSFISKEFYIKQSLEAQIMDWSDDIAYSVHDIEDYYKAQLVPLDRLHFTTDKIRYEGEFEKLRMMSESEIERYFHDRWIDYSTSIEDQLLNFSGRLGSQEWVALFRKIENSVNNQLVDHEKGERIEVNVYLILSLILLVRSAVPDLPYDGSSKASSILREFGSRFISYFQSSCQLKEVGAQVEDQYCTTHYLYVPDSVRICSIILKTIFKYYVVDTPAVHIMQKGQRKIIRDLYHIMYDMGEQMLRTSYGIEELEWNRSIPVKYNMFLSFNLKLELEQNGESFDTLLAGEERNPFADNSTVREAFRRALSRSVVDFICSLTDRQAVLLHQRLTGDPVIQLSPYWLNG